MKKSLMALAVLGALSGAASAQSSVTMYGIVDIGVQWNELGVNQGTTTAPNCVAGERLGHRQRLPVGQPPRLPRFGSAGQKLERDLHP